VAGLEDNVDDTDPGLNPSGPGYTLPEPPTMSQASSGPSPAQSELDTEIFKADLAETLLHTIGEALVAIVFTVGGLFAVISPGTLPPDSIGGPLAYRLVGAAFAAIGLWVAWGLLTGRARRTVVRADAIVVTAGLRRRVIPWDEVSGLEVVHVESSDGWDSRLAIRTGRRWVHLDVPSESMRRLERLVIVRSGCVPRERRAAK